MHESLGRDKIYFVIAGRPHLVTKNCQVWVVDDDASIRWVLERALDNAGLSVQQFATVEEALKELVYEQPRVVMTDIRMQGKIGIEFLAALGRMFPDIRGLS